MTRSGHPSAPPLERGRGSSCSKVMEGALGERDRHLDRQAREAVENGAADDCRSHLEADKMDEPVWRKLPETVSFILASTDHGKTEAHLSFWGEHFTAHSAGRDLPRYIFHGLGHSELMLAWSTWSATR